MMVTSGSLGPQGPGTPASPWALIVAVNRAKAQKKEEERIFEEVESMPDRLLCVGKTG